MGAAVAYLLGRPAADGATGSPWAPLAFPLVGLGVGIAWVLASRILIVLPRTSAVAAAAILLVDAVLTGALHLRSFAQAVDDFPPARAGGPRWRRAFLGARRGGAPPSERAGTAAPAAGGAGQPRVPAPSRELQDLHPVLGAGAAMLLLVVLLRFGVLFFAAEFDYRLLTVPLSGRAAMLWLLWRSTADAGRTAPLASALGRPAPAALAGAAVLTVTGAAAAGTRGLVALGMAVVAGLLWDLRLQLRDRARTGVEVAAGGFVAETLALLSLGAV